MERRAIMSDLPETEPRNDTQSAQLPIDNDDELDVVDLMDEDEQSDDKTAVPDVLAILPLRGVVVYPHTVVPLTVGQPRSVRLVDEVMNTGKIVGLFTARDPELEMPGPDDIYRVGTLASIHRMFRAPDGTIRMLVQGLTRLQLDEYTATEPYLKARAHAIPEQNDPSLEVEALTRTVVTQFQRLAELVPNIPGELITSALNMDDPLQLVYTIATYMRIDLE
jgi:ATP-dependent Lon protease